MSAVTRPVVRLPGWPGRLALATATGVAALLTAVALEVLGLLPGTELVLALLAGSVFLLAGPRLGARSEGRARLLLGAAASSVLVVDKLSEVTANRVLLALYLPALGFLVVAGLALREATVTSRTLEDERQRARLDGEERERRRWARELHDDTLQELGALQVLLAGAARTDDPMAVREAIEDASALIAHQISALRHLIADLRPLALDQLGLGPALDTLCRRAGDGGRLTVDLEVDLAAGPDGPVVRLPAATEATVYRVVQEALTNVVRHSEARHAWVRIRRHGGRLEVSVRDDGVGYRPESLPPPRPGEGFGVAGIRERARLAGGSARVSSAPGRGTTVHLDVPA